jgi:hypothetical protein
MEAVRESWTDGRLDDLNQSVGAGFARIDSEARALRLETRTEFVAVRGEIQAVRGEVHALRSETKAGFERVDERFDALHRLLIQFCGMKLAALIGLIASLVGVLVTQL